MTEVRGWRPPASPCAECGTPTKAQRQICAACVTAARAPLLLRMGQELTVLRCARELALKAMRRGEWRLAMETLAAVDPPGLATWFNGEVPEVLDLPPHPITLLRDAA